jgi:hypothetical protein
MSLSYPSPTRSKIGRLLGGFPVELLFDLVALGGSLGTLVLVALGMKGSLRLAFALVFVLVGPGQAIVGNWPASWPPLWPATRRGFSLAIPILISLSLLVWISLIALWLHSWHPIAIFEVEATACALALVIAILRTGIQVLEGSRGGRR